MFPTRHADEHYVYAGVTQSLAQRLFERRMTHSLVNTLEHLSAYDGYTLSREFGKQRGERSSVWLADRQLYSTNAR